MLHAEERQHHDSATHRSVLQGYSGSRFWWVRMHVCQNAMHQVSWLSATGPTAYKVLLEEFSGGLSMDAYKMTIQLIIREGWCTWTWMTTSRRLSNSRCHFVLMWTHQLHTLLLSDIPNPCPLLFTASYNMVSTDQTYTFISSRRCRELLNLVKGKTYLIMGQSKDIYRQPQGG